MGERLHVVPYVAPDQVVDYLAGADAGLVPLRHRPNHEISLVTKYMEYAQARLPLVVSDVRVMAAFTREHGFGEVFRVQDGAPGLAAAVRTVLDDPRRYRGGLRRRGGRAGDADVGGAVGRARGPLRAHRPHLPAAGRPAV